MRIATKRDDQFLRCMGKERFTTQAMASRVASLSMQRREGIRRHAYKCPACGGYHVGSALVASGDRDFKREREQLRLREIAQSADDGDGIGMEFA